MNTLISPVRPPRRTRKHESRVWAYPEGDEIRWAFGCRCGTGVADLASEDEALEHERAHTDPSYVRPIQAETLYTSKGHEVEVRMTDDEARIALRPLQLDARGRPNSFIESLVDRRRWSPKQRAWAHKLANDAADRASAPPPPEPTDSGDRFTRLVEMMQTAARSLKHPRVVVGFDAGTLRLNIAGLRAKVPGSLSVTSGERHYEDRTWYGRVHTDGRFEPGRRCPDWVLDALREFNADPAEAARIQGQRYGNCCFCSRELTTTMSVTAGYGPVCADRYGLPWG